MSQIKLLPPQISNKIAAGEVVERPVSVVKELVENSIDANSKNITIEVKDSGRYIRVSDDGDGIAPNEISLAFLRFATSKIQTEEDLWNIGTLGFRGEALASIAAVSKLLCISCNQNNNIGKKLVIHGGEIIEETDIGASKGTSIEVAELFYNTPARLKFLKSENTEIGLIEELISSYAIAYPHISFKLLKQNKKVIHTLGNLDTLEVLRLLYGKEFTNNLFYYENIYNDLELKAYLSSPKYFRNSRDKQIFFVNNRLVKIQGFNKILDEVYSSFLPDKTYPIGIIFIQIPNNKIDVNVHPTKKEVKFRNSNYVYNCFRNFLFSALENSRVKIKQEVTYTLDRDKNAQFVVNETKTIPENNKGTFIEYLKKLDEDNINSKEDNISFNRKPRLNYTQDSLTIYQEEKKNDKKVTLLGQIWNTYIAFYTEDDIYFIDQHIAHERYIYEQLKEHSIQSQYLIIPVKLKVSSLEMGILKDNEGLFNQYGFKIEYVDENNILITAVPDLLINQDINVVFIEILNDLKDSDTTVSLEEKKDKIRKNISCKSAIKAGEFLTNLQMQELINKWFNTLQPITCPHGRPISFVINKKEFNKKFNR